VLTLEFFTSNGVI